MLLTLLVAATLATPQQIDTAGRKAFSALRDLERVVRAHSKARDAWPTPDQQPDLAAKLYVAHETVRDSLALGSDLVPGQGLGPQAASLLRAEQGAIGALGTLTVNAPADVQKAMRKVTRTFTALFALFPPADGETDVHPPPRPKGIDGRGYAVRGKAIRAPLDRRTHMSVWCECVHPMPEWNGHTRTSMLVCQSCGYRSRTAEG